MELGQKEETWTSCVGRKLEKEKMKIIYCYNLFNTLILNQHMRYPKDH
jgi:hypothetical protein